MECRNCYEALSARLDGEQEPGPAGETDRHLAVCVACRSWEAHAMRVTRVMRVRAVPAIPDLTACILERAPAVADTGRSWARAALCFVALAQFTFGVIPFLTLGAVGRNAGAVQVAHLFTEATARHLAVGIGLCWVVLRPSAAAGQIPVLGGFVLALLGVSAPDFAVGAFPLAHIAEHSLLVAGLVLLVVVHRGHRRAGLDGTAS